MKFDLLTLFLLIIANDLQINQMLKLQKSALNLCEIIQINKTQIPIYFTKKTAL